MPHFFSAAPARRLQIGDAKVRTGVHRRSGCVTGAGGEASKARNAEVCLRAGWRMRRPAAGAPSASAARRLRRTRPNAERRWLTLGGREQVSGRFFGCIQAAVALLDGGGFATARGWPDMHLPVPRSGADPARQDAMSRRTRQTAQQVHAAVYAQSVHAVSHAHPIHAVSHAQPVHVLVYARRRPSQLTHERTTELTNFRSQSLPRSRPDDAIIACRVIR